jgi:hypothetical protein
MSSAAWWKREAERPRWIKYAKSAGAILARLHTVANDTSVSPAYRAGLTMRLANDYAWCHARAFAYQGGAE